MGRKAGLIAALVILGAPFVLWYVLPGDERTLNNALRYAELAALLLGGLSVFFLAEQLKQQRIWNATLSYHQLFSDLPKPHRVAALHYCLNRLGVPHPSIQTPLREEDVRTILADETRPGEERRRGDSDGGLGGILAAEKVVANYLDDFEELCAAINGGILDEEYVYDIEGARVIRAYHAFGPLINYWRTEPEEGNPEKYSPSSETDRASTPPVATKFFCELESVAMRWSQWRSAEKASAGIRATRRIRLAVILRSLADRVASWAAHSGKLPGVDKKIP